MTAVPPTPRAVPPELAGRSVVVLAGGRSSEREVSLRSGEAVHAALSGAVGEGGLASLELVEIDGDGAWRHADGPRDPVRCVAELPADAVYFLALHGGEGEDGSVQGFLSCAGRAHTGSGVGASALAMDKAASRAVLAEAGLTVAPGVLVQAFGWSADPAGQLARATALDTDAWFVKPNHGGSSTHTFLVSSASELSGAIEEVLATGDSALVEARVQGTEATCGVLGGPEDARALPPVEIVPADERFFDYQQKYDENGARELCPPESLDAPTCVRLADAALLAHRTLGCEGYSRTDFIVRVGDGAPVLLEVNTLPGLTARSLQPQAAAVVGLGFPGLCLELLRLGASAERRLRR